MLRQTTTNLHSLFPVERGIKQIECFHFLNFLHCVVESTLFIIFVPKSKGYSAPLLAEVSSWPSLSVRRQKKGVSYLPEDHYFPVSFCSSSIHGRFRHMHLLILCTAAELQSTQSVCVIHSFNSLWAPQIFLQQILKQNHKRELNLERTLGIKTTQGVWGEVWWTCQ